MSEQIPSWESFAALPYERVEALEKQLRPTYQPDSDMEPDADRLVQHYMYAQVAFALAVLEKRRSDWPNSERFRELVGHAARTCYLFCNSSWVKRSGDTSDAMCNTIEFLKGLIWIEEFNISAADGNFEDALNRLSNGVDQLGEYGGDVEALDFDPQQAVHCFEMLRAQPGTVKDWADVSLSCYDFVSSLLDLGFDRETKVKDDSGALVSWRDYWLTARGFAESRLSPDEYRTWKEREEREHTERHMAHLFFPGVWKQLPKLAQDALVQAEVMWWVRDRSTKSAVVDNIWKATRAIVLERLLTPFGHYAASGPIKGFAELKAITLLSDGSQAPDLSDLMKVTWQAPQFPAFARTLGLGEQEYTFLLSVESDLWTLIKLRNNSTHSDKVETIEPHDVEWAYRTFLGVGCEGILPRLAKLKPSTPQGKSR